MKTIILIPTRDGDEVLPLCLERISELDPAPSEVIFLPTGPAPAIDEWEWDGKKTILTERIPSEERNMFSETAAIMQTLLEAARERDPDYAIIVGDDMQILSKDAITSLTSWDVDLIGCAALRKARGGVNVDFFDFIPQPGGGHTARCIVLPPGEYSGWCECPPLPEALYNPTVVGGGGLCMSRRAIQDERLFFNPSLKDFSEDFSYCLRAREVGYEVWVDATVRVSHNIDPRGRPWAREVSPST